MLELTDAFAVALDVNREQFLPEGTILHVLGAPGSLIGMSVPGYTLIATMTSGFFMRPEEDGSASVFELARLSPLTPSQMATACGFALGTAAPFEVYIIDPIRTVRPRNPWKEIWRYYAYPNDEVYP